MGALRELVKPHPSKQFSQVIPFHRGQVMSAAMFDITLSPAAHERDEIKLLKPSSFDQLGIRNGSETEQGFRNRIME